MYLLDTDISIYLLNGRLPQVAARLADLDRDEVGTTAITAAELVLVRFIQDDRTTTCSAWRLFSHLSSKSLSIAPQAYFSAESRASWSLADG
ncbi:MAG TPA: hypothetical protein VGE98_12930 [Thermoanaerobaculia bacterium]